METIKTRQTSARQDLSEHAKAVCCDVRCGITWCLKIVYVNVASNMGKCKFNEICLENSAFSAWLKPVENNPFEARCTLCKKTLKLASLGMKALDGRSEKHNATLKSQQQTPAITQFCSGSLGASPGPSATQSALSTLTPTTPVSDLRTAFGSTPTLKAEVLWTLHTVAKHQSYKSNDDIGELFQTMFPDSDIAKTFKLGKDKNYITRFGLADFIERQLYQYRVCYTTK